jgi:hypothetical protein
VRSDDANDDRQVDEGVRDGDHPGRLPPPKSWRKARATIAVGRTKKGTVSRA